MKKKSIVLVHGVFDDAVFKTFKKGDGYFVLEGRPDLAASKSTIKALSKLNILGKTKWG